MKNLYEILEIPPTATPQEIRAAYRSMALLYHPDKNSSPEATERFKEVGGAYEILSDVDKRRRYDAGEFTATSIPVPNQTAASAIFQTFMQTYAFTKNPQAALLFAGMHALYSVRKAYKATQTAEYKAQEKLNLEFFDKLQATHYANGRDKLNDLVATLRKGADINYGKPSAFGIQFSLSLLANSYLSVTALEIIIEKQMGEEFESLVLDHPNFIAIPNQLTIAIRFQKERIMDVLTLRGLVPTSIDLTTAIDCNPKCIAWLVTKGAKPESIHMDSVLLKGFLSSAALFKALGVIPKSHSLSKLIKENKPDLALLFLQYGAKPSQQDMLDAILINSPVIVRKIHEVSGYVPHDLKFQMSDSPALEGLSVVEYLVKMRNQAMLAELDKMGTHKEIADNALNTQRFFYNAVSAASAAVVSLFAYHLAAGTNLQRSGGYLLMLAICAVLTIKLYSYPGKKKVDDDQIYLNNALHQ